MRRNRSQSAKRRSHHGLGRARISEDESGNMYQSHRVNPVTGMYKGRVVIDMVAKAKRTDRRLKRRDKELRESGHDTSKKESSAT